MKSAHYPSGIANSLLAGNFSGPVSTPSPARHSRTNFPSECQKRQPTADFRALAIRLQTTRFAILRDVQACLFG